MHVAASPLRIVADPAAPNVAEAPRPAPAPRERILHVFRAPVGGLFRHVLDVARLQVAAGHEVTGMTRSESKAEAVARAADWTAG